MADHSVQRRSPFTLVSRSGIVALTPIQKASQFPFETRTSFQRDVETKGRQSEWGLFGGTVMRYAEKLGLRADNTRVTLDRLLKII